ncbi:MAG: hypothetical protein K0R98_1927 [Rickettsiaceae bacterium]|jgi:hypothetical protein|nr:hypothetical protein [Rickettsiaceae bacterium]
MKIKKYIKIRNDSEISIIKKVTLVQKETHPEITISLKTGGTIKLEREQVPHFIFLALKEDVIDKELAETLIMKLQKGMPYIQDKSPTPQKALNKIYSELYKTIEAEKKSAESSGKKLLVLIGEDHIDRRSLIAEAMAINICKDVGVNDFITETTPNLLKSILKDHADQITSPNYSFALKVAQTRGINLHSGDPKQFSMNPGKREKAINTSITTLDKNSIMIVGVCHLKHILESKDIKEKYNVVAIDASFIDKAKKEHQLYKFKNFSLKEELDYATSSKKIIHLEIPNNPYVMTTAEMIQATIISRENVTQHHTDKEALKIMCSNISKQPKQLSYIIFPSYVFSRTIESSKDNTLSNDEESSRSSISRSSSSSSIEWTQSLAIALKKALNKTDNHTEELPDKWSDRAHSVSSSGSGRSRGSSSSSSSAHSC